MCPQVRAGADYKQLHIDAHLALAAILKDAGVLRVSPADALSRGLRAAFFPPGLGPAIGLPVHPVARFAAPAPRRPTAPHAANPFSSLPPCLVPGRRSSP